MALVKIQVRRDTAANWTASNPVLAVGEPGLETDTGKVKYGDGVRNWNTLPYSSGVALGSSAPPAAGTAAAGTSETAARSDHSHALPSNLTASTVTTTGNASVGGSLTVSGSLVGGSHRHFASEIEGLTAEVFSQLASAIKAGANVNTTVDSVARTITVSSTATASTPLSISSDPLDVISSGATASFTARAVGGAGAVSYQWEQSADAGKTWGSVAGATGITLTVSGIVAADDGKQYRMRASAGSETVFSRPATLTVADVTVVAQPADVTTGVGGIVQLSAQANAGAAAITYQWQRRGSSTASWENIPTATLATYSYSATAVNDADGDQFRVAITSLGRTVYSRTATVIVRGSPLSISVQPTDVTDSGGAASFSVTAVGGVTPYTYQWQRLNGGSSTWAATDDFTNIPSGTSGVSGQTTATLSLTGQNAAQHQRKYRVLVADADGGAATSVIATLSTLSLRITVEPSDVAALAGAGVAADAFKALATADGGVTYQWQKSTDNGATWTNVTGATNANYGSFAPVLTDNGARYRCAVTGDGQTLNTQSATLSVTLPPEAGLRVTSTLDATYAPVPSLYLGNSSSNIPCSPFGAGVLVEFTYAGGLSSGITRLWWEKQRDVSGQLIWEKWSSVTERTPAIATTGTYYAYAEVLPEGQNTPFNSALSGCVLSVTGYATAPPIAGYVTDGVYRIGFSHAASTTAAPRTAYTTSFSVPVPSVRYTYPSLATITTGGTRVVATAVPTSTPCGGVTLQWQRLNPSTNLYENIAGQTSETLSINPASDNFSVTDHVVRLMATCGAVKMPQSVITVRVQNPPLEIVNQPQDTTAALGVASFSFSHQGGPSGTPSIRWQRALVNGGFVDIAGANGAQLNLSGITTSLNGSQYRAILTVGASTVTTRSATLTVTGSTITLQPRDTTASTPDGRATFTFDFTSTCTTPLILWERQAPTNTFWIPIPTATGKTLTLEGLTESLSGTKVRASVICDGVVSSSAVASVAVPSFRTFVTEPASQSVAPGATVFLSFTSGLPVGTYQFHWEYRRGSGGRWAKWAGPQSGQTVSFTASFLEHNDLRFRVAMYPWYAGPVYSTEAVVTIGQSRSAVSIDSTPNAQVIGVACAKGSVVALLSYQTQIAKRSTDDGATWRNVFLPSAAYWDGIVATGSGRLIAYSEGSEGVDNAVPNGAFESPPTPATLAASDDGGLTWRTLSYSGYLGERLRIWHVPYPSPGGALLAFHWGTNRPTPSGKTAVVGQNTAVGQMSVSLNDGASWTSYPMPLTNATGPRGSGTKRLVACSVAMSPSGVLVVATIPQGGTVRAPCSYSSDGTPSLQGWDYEGLMLYRDVASAGWGAPSPSVPTVFVTSNESSPPSFAPLPPPRRR